MERWSDWTAPLGLTTEPNSVYVDMTQGGRGGKCYQLTHLGNELCQLLHYTNTVPFFTSPVDSRLIGCYVVNTNHCTFVTLTCQQAKPLGVACLYQWKFWRVQCMMTKMKPLLCQCFTSPAQAFTSLVIISAKEDMFLSLFVCLSICLLATVHKNFRADLHEIFREGWQWVNKQTIKFWWRSGSRIQICIMTLVRHALAEVCTVPVLLIRTTSKLSQVV